MSDVLLPNWLDWSQVEPRYIDSTALSRGLYTGKALTTALGGDHWVLPIGFTKQGGLGSISTQLERATLKAFIAKLRGKQNRIFVAPAGQPRRGSFSSSELIINGTFANGVTGWTTGTQNTIAVSDRILAATRSSVSAATFSIQSSSSITTVSGVPYVLRAFLSAGRGAYPNAGFRFRVGATLLTGGLFTGTTTTSFGLLTDVYTASGTTAFPALEDLNTAGVVVGDHFFVPFISMSRCFLVNGAAGSLVSQIEVDQLDISANGQLLPGDFFELITSNGSELKIVTDPLNSTASGQGTLRFLPPARGTISDNSPIIVSNPMGKFLFAGEFPEWMDEPGLFINASIELEEA